MPRGIVTEEIKAHKLGKDIAKEEVRLIAYLFDRIHNAAPLIYSKLNMEELTYLERWENEGRIKTIENVRGLIKLTVTEKFYDFMALVMKYAYAQAYIIKDE